MIAAAALVSVAIGLLVGAVLLARTAPRIGPSWEDWRDAERIGGRRSWMIGLAVSTATMVGIVGFGVPAVLRVALLGLLVGFCLPFAIEGARRWSSRAR